MKKILVMNVLTCLIVIFSLVSIMLSNQQATECTEANETEVSTQERMHRGYYTIKCGEEDVKQIKYVRDDYSVAIDDRFNGLWLTLPSDSDGWSGDIQYWIFASGIKM